MRQGGSTPCPALSAPVRQRSRCRSGGEARRAGNPLVQNKALLSTFSQRAQTDRLSQQRGEALECWPGQQDCGIQASWSLLRGSEALEIHPRPFLALPLLSLLSPFPPKKVFSWLLKRVGKNPKIQVVWGVSGVSSGQCQTNWEINFKHWSQLNRALEVVPVNCSSGAEGGEGLQAATSSCQHQWQSLSHPTEGDWCFLHWRRKAMTKVVFSVQHHHYAFEKFHQWRDFLVNKWIQEAF